MITTYRKKPVEVQAMRIDPDTSHVAGSDLVHRNSLSVTEVSGWMLGHGFDGFRVHGDDPFGLAIDTLEGTMIANPGDWIIRGVKGEFYPCKPDIFEATYDAVVTE